MGTGFLVWRARPHSIHTSTHTLLHFLSSTHTILFLRRLINLLCPAQSPLSSRSFLSADDGVRLGRRNVSDLLVLRFTFFVCLITLNIRTWGGGLQGPSTTWSTLTSIPQSFAFRSWQTLMNVHLTLTVVIPMPLVRTTHALTGAHVSWASVVMERTVKVLNNCIPCVTSSDYITPLHFLVE